MKSVFAAVGVVLVSASCTGGGSSLPQSVNHAPLAPSSAQRAAADRDRDGHPTPAPSPAPAYTLFGDGVLVHPGHNSPTAAQASFASLNGNDPNAYGGVDFSVPASLTLSGLNNLSTDYQFTAGTCHGGSPRFVIGLKNGSTTGNISVYIGPPPNYTGCPPNVWANTGNLASPANLVDDSQLPGGTFYDPYASAQTKYGAYTVTDIALVVDGYALPYMTAQFDNVAINTTVQTFESAASCKHGGWKQFTTSPGPFKNQGQCVRYFNGGKDDGDDGGDD